MRILRGFPGLMVVFCQLNYGAGSRPAPYFCWQNQSQDSDGGKGKKSVFRWGKRRKVRCIHQCFLARRRRQTALETASTKLRARFLMRFARQSVLHSPVFFGAKTTTNSIRNSIHKIENPASGRPRARPTRRLSTRLPPGKLATSHVASAAGAVCLDGEHWGATFR